MLRLWIHDVGPEAVGTAVAGIDVAADRTGCELIITRRRKAHASSR